MRTRRGADDTRLGTIYGLLAYGLWGAFPLYFHALRPAGAWEILCHRILWTFVVCAVVLVVRRDLGWAQALVGRRRLVLGIVLAALLIAANWVIYVGAVISGRTTEASLGYFLNPLVTVALGVLVLRERLRPLQWAAVATGAIAGGYLTVASGTIPWIALSLAVSFASYGLVKKKIGTTLGAMHSLAAETAVLAPVAGVILAVLTAQGATTFTTTGPGHTALLVLSGVATATPLLFFAAAARRIPLVLIGLLMFLTPVLQLLCAVLLLGESLDAVRWVGFGIVWVALVLLTVDALRAARTSRTTQPHASPEEEMP